MYVLLSYVFVDCEYESQEEKWKKIHAVKKKVRGEKRREIYSNLEFFFTVRLDLFLSWIYYSNRYMVLNHMGFFRLTATKTRICDEQHPLNAYVLVLCMFIVHVQN